MKQCWPGAELTAADIQIEKAHKPHQKRWPSGKWVWVEYEELLEVYFFACPVSSLVEGAVATHPRVYFLKDDDSAGDGEDSAFQEFLRTRCLDFEEGEQNWLCCDECDTWSRVDAETHATYRGAARWVCPDGCKGALVGEGREFAPRGPKARGG